MLMMAFYSCYYFLNKDLNRLGYDAKLASDIVFAAAVGGILGSKIYYLIENFANEKTIYERENQIDSFKTKIKPVMGRSLKEDEIQNIVKLKNSNFKNSIKENFIKPR